MKRILTALLTLCLLAALSASVLAAEEETPPDWLFGDDYQEPSSVPDEPEESEPEEPPSQITESAGEEDVIPENRVPIDPPVDPGPPDKYPIGSYVDPFGVVWSPSGERLSPVDAQAEIPLEGDAPTSVLLDDPDGLPAPEIENSDALDVIAGLVSDIATDPPVWSVTDLRPTEEPVVVLDGLKALVTSVFGEYTPVTTTTVISQTVGNDTQQYLVETVAPGAAGVDYEWLAGVVLFAILLFCLMRLLGGVLS